MPSRKELEAANAALRAQLRAGAEARLRAIDGVTHVSVGLKETGGKVTDTLCIRVYVRDKRPDEELSPAQRIPRTLDGVPVDVNVRRRFGFRAVDTTRYRPLKGGALIGNRIIGLNEAGTATHMGAGTLGCFATRTADGAPMLLSNWHVLMAHGARVGDPIYQPVPTRIPDLDAADLPLRPTSEENIVARIADSRITNRVDAAIARLDVSTCCRCCGLDWRDEIVGLSEDGSPPSNRLLGMRRAVAGATVYKVGAVTGRQVGRVVDDAGDDLQGRHGGVDYVLNGQIEIAGDDTLIPFSANGDSGSAIVDDDGYIVGLLFGSTPDLPPAHRTFANHIADVCTALGITINLDRGTQDTAGMPVARTWRPSDADVEVYAHARARVLAQPGGRWLWALAQAHRDEVVQLVTQQRRVSVAWHRAGGPALFAAGLKSLRAGGDALPVPVEGTLDVALARVGDALAAHGGPRLRAALAAHQAALLEAVRHSRTLDELLGRLDGPAGTGVDQP